MRVSRSIVLCANVTGFFVIVMALVMLLENANGYRGATAGAVTICGAALASIRRAYIVSTRQAILVAAAAAMLIVWGIIITVVYHNACSCIVVCVYVMMIVTATMIVSECLHYCVRKSMRPLFLPL